MAEFVQLRKEKWTEPLNLLVQVGILYPREIKTLLVNLDNFEYKIQSQSRKLEDILKYIQFECNLLSLIQARRKKVNDYELSEEIDRFIYNEIKSQFGSAEINFTHSIDFWNAKLRFVATIVPDHEKETEFNVLFKKALNYCGRANLDIYKSCVDYLWTFARSPSLTVTPRKRKRLTHRRDVSKLMANIRQFTTQAVRNFPRSPDASVFLLITELKYLQLLREEAEIYQSNPKDVCLPYNLDDEVSKSENLIDVIYEDLVKKHSEAPLVYIQLHDAIRLLPLAEAKKLAKKLYSRIVSSKSDAPQVFAWLIGRCIDENKIDEFLERINQALANPGSKVKFLEICLEKLECFLSLLESMGDPEICLPRLLEFYIKLVHKNNAEWNQVRSERLQESRIQLIKKLPKLIERLPATCDQKLVRDLKTFQSQHELISLVKTLIQQFPTSFVLVRERVTAILRKPDDKIKPAVIFKYLEAVSWKHCKTEDAFKFFKVLYYAFLSSGKLSKEKHMNLFMTLVFKSFPTTNEVGLFHLKKLYLEDVEMGRNFYLKYRFHTSDWRFPCKAINIETVMCKRGESESLPRILLEAYEDAVRMGETLSTEPWKTCIESLCKLKREKEACEMKVRAIQKFTGEGCPNTGDCNYEDEFEKFYTSIRA